MAAAMLSNNAGACLLSAAELPVRQLAWQADMRRWCNSPQLLDLGEGCRELGHSAMPATVDLEVWQHLCHQIANLGGLKKQSTDT